MAMFSVLQVATMLGACLTKDEVEEFMNEADVVRKPLRIKVFVLNPWLFDRMAMVSWTMTSLSR